jgi:hypothetical protein
MNICISNYKSRIANAIYPILVEYKASSHCVIVDVDMNDITNIIRLSELTQSHCVSRSLDIDNNEARWLLVLDEMIWAFEQQLTDWSNMYYTIPDDVYTDDDLMSDKKFDLFNFDQNGFDNHQARIQNGLDLFAKYYMRMWP